MVVPYWARWPLFALHWQRRALLQLINNHGKLSAEGNFELRSYINSDDSIWLVVANNFAQIHFFGPRLQQIGLWSEPADKELEARRNLFYVTCMKCTTNRSDQPSGKSTDTYRSPLADGGKMAAVEEPSFWRCAAALDGSITRLIFWDVAIVGLSGVVWMLLYEVLPSLHLEIGPVEIAGGVLGFMVVFRTNGGYERWWEGRKLWGKMTNAVRSLTQAGLAFCTEDEAWRKRWVCWCVAFPHACRMSLRSSRDPADLARLLGQEEAQKICDAIHIPSYVTYRLADLIAEASRMGSVPHYAAINLEHLREQLVDVIGGCERIASTPLPRVYILKFRRFIAIYLLCMPSALVGKVGWATPLLSMLVAYPALGLDRIAQELQSPFSSDKISHLPLDSICRAIEENGMGLLERAQPPRPRST